MGPMEHTKEAAKPAHDEGATLPLPSVPFLSPGMKGWPDFVAWRLANGSMCHLCPLNGKRKVGCDGDPRADHIGIGEAPGKDESEDGIAWGLPFGRPFKGRAGYLFKLEMLGAADLATVEELDPSDVGKRWPRVSKIKVWMGNLAMCQPPKNKITSKEGKKAVVACGESLKKLVLMLLRANLHRTLDPMGAYPTSFLLGKTPATPGFKAVPIESYRGYEMGPYDLAFYEKMLAPTPDIDRIRYLLRGVKPPPIWVGVKREEPLVYHAMTFDPVDFTYRETSIRYDLGWKPLVTWIIKALDKAGKDAEKEAAIAATPAEIIEWGKEYRKQKAAATRAAKKGLTLLDVLKEGIEHREKKKRDDTGRKRRARRDDGVPDTQGELLPAPRRRRSKVVRVGPGYGND